LAKKYWKKMEIKWRNFGKIGGFPGASGTNSYRPPFLYTKIFNKKTPLYQSINHFFLNQN
jgi:hypothetical protein